MHQNPYNRVLSFYRKLWLVALMLLELSKCYSIGMQSRGLDVLRSEALVLVVVAAIVSSGLMLHVAQYRLSVLMVFFAVWDLSPFAGLFLAGIVSKQWQILMRAALYAVMLLVAGESVVIYGRVAVKRPTQPAFAFLIVPLFSWVLLIVVLLIAHVVSTKRSGHQPLFDR